MLVTLGCWFDRFSACCMEVCSDGERDRVLLLLLLLLLRRPVACKFEICLFKLATSAISSLNSVVCEVATLAKDGETDSDNRLKGAFLFELKACLNHCVNESTSLLMSIMNA